MSYKIIGKYIKELKLKPNKSYIIDIGSNDGVALKPFKDLGFKKILGIEPAKNLAKLANKNKIKTFNGFLEDKNLKINLNLLFQNQFDLLKTEEHHS